MPVRIALAGRVGIECDGQPVPTDGIRIAGWVALAHLIAERHRPVRQDELADVIWGEELPRSWATMVRGLVSKLRVALSAAGLGSDTITTAFGCYQLQLPHGVVVDIHEAAAEVALAEAALAAGRPAEGRERAARACAVAAGQFLPGAPGGWVERRQKDLFDLRVRALEALSQAAAACGAPAEAVASAEEAVTLEPLRESTHLRLIAAHAAAGNRAEALRAYERCRVLLAEELGVRPSTAVEARYLQLLAEEQDPEPAPSARVDVGDVPAALARAGQAPFIGRAAELDQLQALWRQAAAGARLAAAVGGEAGIGKTTLTAQLARAVHADGGRVLYGRCDEELDVPHQPVTEVVRLALAELSARELAAHVNAWGGALARLVPDLVSRLPDAPPASSDDSQTQRWRLFEAVDALLSDLSASAPLLVVLDDVHWAGSPAIALLRHVLRSARPASMLVVGAYRHDELDRGHGLASLLTDLRRDGTLTRFDLEGLAAEDVSAFLGSMVITPADDRFVPFASALHQTTRGNPFFIGEVLRHLVATGVLSEDGAPPSPQHLERAVSEGVREVVTRRLLRLAATSNRVLAAAAVCGVEFEAAVIGEMEGLDAVLDGLDEAMAANLVVEGGAPGRFSFCHALVRHTIFDQLGPVRRSRLHRRVGEALEHRYGTRGPHVGALARHFAAAAPLGVGAKAADYALAAASAALDQLAFEEAVGLLKTGLNAIDAGPADPERTGALLIALGTIYVRYDDFAAVQDVGGKLVALAELSASPAHFGWGVYFSGIGRLDTDEERTELLREALDRLGHELPSLRAQLLMQLARALEGLGALGEQAARDAVALARRTPEPPGLLRSVLYGFVNVLRWRGDPADLPEWLTLADEIVGIEAHLPAAVGNGVRVRAAARLRTGDRDGFEADLDEIARRREKSPSTAALALMIRFRALAAALDGRLADLESLARELHQVRGPSLIDKELELAHMLFFVRREQGCAANYLPELEARIAARPPHILNHAVLGLARAEAGDLDGGRLAWDALAPRIADLPPSWDRAGAMALVAQLLCGVGDTNRATALYDLLRPHAGLFVNPSGPAFFPMAADRALGQLAATAGDLPAAEQHFQAAIAIEERLRALALSARTRYTYARALRDAGGRHDCRKAEVLLGEARATANALGLDGLARAIPQAAPQMTSG